MTNNKKTKAILLIEKIRLIETELFRLSGKYGVKTVEEFDQQIKTGKLSEKFVGDDVFTFDHLMVEKEKLEKRIYHFY